MYDSEHVDSDSTSGTGSSDDAGAGSPSTVGGSVDGLRDDDLPDGRLLGELLRRSESGHPPLVGRVFSAHSGGSPEVSS